VTKRKELRQVYGGPRPKSYLPAHNHVAHDQHTGHGQGGFRRFWIPPSWVRERKFVACPCGWSAPSWDKSKPHYAAPEHVRGWRQRIKKHGSLEEACRAVARETWVHYPPQLKAMLKKLGARNRR
jgi:hypothetical protein